MQHAKTIKARRMASEDISHQTPVGILDGIRKTCELSGLAGLSQSTKKIRFKKKKKKKKVTSDKSKRLNSKIEGIIEDSEGPNSASK